MTNNGPQSMLEGKPLLMLMDGHALVHRAWHAIREPLTVRATGEDVRGVYGFVNSFIRSLQDWEPTHCAIAFDLPVPTFRHERFKEYKAHRPPTPPELRSQFERIRQLLEAFEIPVYQCEGYEADDVLGTLCRQAEEQEIETVILTGDSDTLQLVSPWVRVFMSSSVQQTKVYDVAGVKDRYGGLGPEAVADIKALQGDSSDNIPGVPGVGIKTAVNLVSKFGDIEQIIAHVDEVTPPRAQKNIRAGVEQLRESKVLTTIVRDAPVTLDLEASRFWQYDRSKVVGFLTDLEFLSVVPRIPVPSGGPAEGEQQSFDTTPTRRKSITASSTRRRRSKVWCPSSIRHEDSHSTPRRRASIRCPPTSWACRFPPRPTQVGTSRSDTARASRLQGMTCSKPYARSSRARPFRRLPTMPITT